VAQSREPLGVFHLLPKGLAFVEGLPTAKQMLTTQAQAIARVSGASEPRRRAPSHYPGTGTLLHGRARNRGALHELPQTGCACTNSLALASRYWIAVRRERPGPAPVADDRDRTQGRGLPSARAARSPLDGAV